MRDFDTWLSTFRKTVANFTYYTDFEKCAANAEKYRYGLHMMNGLIGQPNVEDEFRKLARRYPTIVRIIPTLLAVRYNDIRVLDVTGERVFHFKPCSNSLDEYCMFMRESGLFNLIENRLTNNLYDYVLGVEVGLDSNARKNRTGKAMEALVESFIHDAGFDRVDNPQSSDVDVYVKEMYLRDVERVWGYDLSALSNDGNTSKRFDYVVRTKSCVYGIEVNFYSSSGSKLNETARSYKMLAIESKSIPRFEFVWFTDGAGWNSAKRNLRETFDVLPTLYNVAELEQGICSELFV